MLNVPFAKLSPGGNTTILLSIPAPPIAERARMANELMHPLHLGAEQVGFADMGAELPRLEMMGGEFCGNAARSFAALLAMEGHPALEYCDTRGECEGMVAISGAHTPVQVRVRTCTGSGAGKTVGGSQGSSVPEKGACGGADGTPRRAAACLDASVRLTVPDMVGECLHAVEQGMDVVRLQGITHVMLDAQKHPLPTPLEQGEVCGGLRRRLGLEGEAAAGCVWYARHGDSWRIDPVVWVRETGSTHYETGCGSGTVALGLLVAGRSGEPFVRDVRQPSGQCIRAAVTLAGPDRFGQAWIGGPVRLVARGEAFLYSV
ncbi:hypothetical protein [Desulfovibrio psychrotolerans]|uniref:Diaminopimelate epimerase n=1 Tax=Desulfovibrio psychrotolerans TaxID=415242 RepID=A0A7J0BS96_9BACT|nr:hypothetical protein [Desulfovibrio psychrotolerans]GFM36025.1 hypothetical protein DSM19430T_07090 [Desulfovibrio psychrotolerans]